MASDDGSEVTRFRDGRLWRIGGEAEVAWIRKGTSSGLAITSGVPPVFEAYATVELPGTGHHTHETITMDDDQDRPDQAVLSLLAEHTVQQPWWLGYLEYGETAELVFHDAPRVTLYEGWCYVLIEAGAQQAADWREDSSWKGSLPDLIFPTDRSWLLSTLWDDDWTCIGGPQTLVDGFLCHPELRARARQVYLSTNDATPPGHQAI